MLSWHNPCRRLLTVQTFVRYSRFCPISGNFIDWHSFDSFQSSGELQVIVVLASFVHSTNRLSRRSWLYSPLFGFAFSCLLFGYSSRSDASCGDYLGHQGMATENRSSAQSHFGDSERVPSRSPCRGPHCQQAPTEAPMPVPATTVESHDRWIWITTIPLRPMTVTSSLAQLSEPFLLQVISDRLDRPPRI